MKKTIYIILGALIVAGIIFAGFYFRKKSSKQPASGQISQLDSEQVGEPSQYQNQQETSPREEATSEEKFGVVTENQVADYFIDSDNNLTFIEPSGKVMRLSASGELLEISGSQTDNLTGASFSYNGKKALIRFGSSKTPQFSVFDTETKIWQPLPLEFKSVAWSPEASEIIYLAEKGDKKVLGTLEVANPKAKTKELLELYIEDAEVSWPIKDQILIRGKGTALAEESLWSFNVPKKTLAPIFEYKSGLQAIHGGENQKILFFESNINLKGGFLTLFDLTQNKSKRLSFLTLPSKCAFSSEAISIDETSTIQINQEILYCGIPRNSRLFSISTLPDDYLMKKIFTEDNIYKINLENGVISTVFDDYLYNIDVINPRVINKRLFFINRFDQRLYAINLAANS